MIEVLRLSLLLVLAGSALTALVALFAWYAEEHRRMGRAFRRVLGMAPDAELIAHGRGRGAAFSLAADAMAVAWDAGAWCLVYRLDEVVGAELAIDGQVAARAFRGEARRPLDHRPREAQSVSLRLIFDDPQHPDFELPLWPPAQSHRRGQQDAGQMIQDANRWLARVESVLRRAAPAPQLQNAQIEARQTQAPPPQVRQLEPPPPPPQPRAAPPTAVTDEVPPWEDDPEDVDLPNPDLDKDGQGRLL